MNNMKKERKLSKRARILLFSGGGVGLLAVGIILFVLLTSQFLPQSTGEHLAMNSLPDTIPGLVYFKEGSAYLYENGQPTLLAENMYDPDDPAAAESLNYSFDIATKSFAYMQLAEDKSYTLQLYQNGATTLISRNVDKNCSLFNYQRIAYILQANQTSGTGMLMLYDAGARKLLDSNIVAGSPRFSKDGSTLYALATASGLKNSTLRIYKKANGWASSELLKGVDTLSWCSADGSRFLAATQLSDKLANCQLGNGNSVKEFKNVYITAVSADESVFYLLADYNEKTSLGTLLVADTKTLHTRELARNVQIFSPTSTTDLSKGILFCKPGETEGVSDVYYGSVQGYTLRLAKNCSQSTLQYTVLNTETNTGYMLVKKADESQNALYTLRFDNRKVVATTLDTGYLHEIIYFEKPDSITYIKNGTATVAELYTAKDSKKTLVTKSAGAIFDVYSSAYYGTAILSNNGDSLLTFTNVVVLENVSDSPFQGHPTAYIYGTLNLFYGKTGELKTIADNVRADTFNIIHANADMSEVYYMVLTEKKNDLYLYKNGVSQLICAGIDAVSW